MTSHAYDYEEKALLHALTRLDQERQSKSAAGFRYPLLVWAKKQPALAISLLLLVLSVPLTVLISTQGERAVNASLRADLQTARAEAEDLRRQTTTLQQELAEIRRNAAAAQEQTARLRQALSAAEDRNKMLAARIRNAEDQNRTLIAETNSLRSSLEGFQALRPSLDLRTRATSDQFIQVTENRYIRAGIKKAFELKDERVQFAWNGRDPGTGLDSYGFVSQVLLTSGVTAATKVPDLSTAKLVFQRADKAQPGDILVFTGDHAMLYLGRNRAIGMTPLGVAIQRLELAPRPSLILRVPYPVGY